MNDSEVSVALVLSVLCGSVCKYLSMQRVCFDEQFSIVKAILFVERKIVPSTRCVLLSLEAEN